MLLVFCRNSKAFYTKVVVEESLNLILGTVFTLEEPLFAPVIPKAVLITLNGFHLLLKRHIESLIVYQIILKEL